MKNLKVLLAALIVLIFTIQTNAQWATSSTNIHNTNLGFVGIGTTSPAYLLDVAKNMTAPMISVSNTGGIGGAGFIISDQNSNSKWILKTTSDGYFKMRDQISSLNVLVVEKDAAENSLYIAEGGNIGFGTSTPATLLEVAKNMVGPQITIHNLGGLGGAGFSMIDDLNNGSWKFKSATAGGFKIRDHTSGINVFIIEQNSATNAIYIKAGGNVGIGTDNPTAKLAVNGKIDCKEVDIYLTGWSDYVFDKDYNLPSLYEVEAYIKENKHLPDVPSEKEVLENGVNVGEMQSTLLRKIEELTLYMIELKKENEEMKSQIMELIEK